MGKIIEWIFSQFTFNILQVTLTWKIITCRVSKNLQMDMKGCVWVGGYFVKPWQVTDKIIEWIFYTSQLLCFELESLVKKLNCALA